MVKFGKWIAKHKILILIISVLLLIPSVIGFVTTRVNYDILSYLPKDIERLIAVIPHIPSKPYIDDKTA